MSQASTTIDIEQFKTSAKRLRSSIQHLGGEATHAQALETLSQALFSKPYSEARHTVLAPSNSYSEISITESQELNSNELQAEVVVSNINYCIDYESNYAGDDVTGLPGSFTFLSPLDQLCDDQGRLSGEIIEGVVNEAIEKETDMVNNGFEYAVVRLTPRSQSQDSILSSQARRATIEFEYSDDEGRRFETIKPKLTSIHRGDGSLSGALIDDLVTQSVRDEMGEHGFEMARDLGYLNLSYRLANVDPVDSDSNAVAPASNNMVGSIVRWYDPDPIEGFSHPRTGVVTLECGEVVSIVTIEGSEVEADWDELEVVIPDEDGLYNFLATGVVRKDGEIILQCEAASQAMTIEQGRADLFDELKKAAREEIFDPTLFPNDDCDPNWAFELTKFDLDPESHPITRDER